MISTILFKKNYAATAHTIVNQGGSNSGKTYAILQALFCVASENQKQIITVVSQDIPNLKAGALRDALTIYEGSEPVKKMVKSYNKTDRIFEFNNGTIAADGKLTWSDGVYLLEWYYQHEYKTTT